MKRILISLVCVSLVGVVSARDFFEGYGLQVQEGLLTLKTYCPTTKKSYGLDEPTCQAECQGKCTIEGLTNN